MKEDRNWDDFIDDITDADFTDDDLKRVCFDEQAIEWFDAEKLLSDHCSLRYRYAYLYLAIQAVGILGRPKTDMKESIKHVGRSIYLLKYMKKNMVEMFKKLTESPDAEDESDGEE